MKKLLLAIALIGLFTSNVYASGSACNEWTNFNINLKYGNDYFASGYKVVRFGCIGDNSTGAYPSTAFTAGTMSELLGWSLLMGATVNGATAPTAGYKVAITDENGVDILGNGGNTRPGTAAVSSQFKPLVDSVLMTPGFRPITSNLTLVVTGNSVASAVTTVILYFMKTN